MFSKQTKSFLSLWALCVISFCAAGSKEKLMNRAQKVVKESSSSNPNEQYTSVDTYGYRTSRRPLMAPSWKGGYSRRFLRNNMAPLIGMVADQEEMVSEMESLVSRLISSKKIKVTKDQIENAVADAQAALEAMVYDDTEYAERTSFVDRRGTFLSGGADLAWDFYWGGATITTGWFRKNYRRKSTVDKRFKGLYERLNAVVNRIIRVKVKLQLCFNALGDFDGKQDLMDALKAIEFNAGKAAKIKESQEKKQSGYQFGDASIVPIWETFRDYIEVQMAYSKAMQTFLRKNIGNKHSKLNRVTAVQRR